jgi:hypothetical protein
MDDSGVCNLEATYDCNQGGIYTAKIATHPDLRCNTKCADAAGEIDKCLKPNEYIVTLTGLMDKNLSSIQKCVGTAATTTGSTTPVVTLVTEEEDFERRITEIANQGQKVLDGCGGGGIAAVFI